MIICIVSTSLVLHHRNKSARWDSIYSFRLGVHRRDAPNMVAADSQAIVSPVTELEDNR